MTVVDRVLRMSRALREAGVPIAVSETEDALRALMHVPMDDRATVRAALSTTMIKDESHAAAFGTLFDLFFSSTPASDRPSETTEADDLSDRLVEAMQQGDAGALDGIARDAVARFGRVETAPGGDWYSQYQVLRALQPGILIGRVMSSLPEGTGDLERRLVREELQEMVARLRAATLTETRRRVAESRGPEAVASYAVRPPLEDLAFFSMTQEEVDDLRRAIRPLARKLATRMAMKRRAASRGGVDIRRTMRRSLSTGGAPFDLAYRHRAPHRPELVILCDVSSSVARFSRFALMLTHALSAQFSRVRSFAFVDAIAEVTHFFEHEDFVAAIDRMNEEAKVVRGDGRSDYGRCLESFWETWGPEMGSRTTVLVLGDARNNYRPPETWAMTALHDSVHRLFWLNPEGSDDWGSGDSIAPEYAPHTDGMVEVRNLRQLEDFIARVA